MSNPPVRIYKAGVRLVVDSVDPAVIKPLAKVLQYWRREASENGRSYTLTKSAVYTTDAKKRLFTFFGYYELVVSTLRGAGFESYLEELSPAPPRTFETDWAAVYAHGFNLDDRQSEALAIIATEANGRIACPPGWGKGVVIEAVPILMPNARVAIVVKNLSVLMQRLYPRLSALLPGVGLCYGASKRVGRRVTCYSTGCLGSSSWNEDLVLVDESHQCGTDIICERLAQFQRARVFGFSASHDLRSDGGDFRLLGLTGPIRLQVSYAEAVEAKRVVPVRVIIRRHLYPCDPSEGCHTLVEFNRMAYWRHEERNQLIAADARSYGDDVQVLIYVTTVDHLLRLKALLPEFEPVYAPSRLSKRNYAAAVDLGLQPMTGERFAAITKQFTTGEIKKVIVTTCWNVGVDFPQLAVLIRADGGASDTDAIQVPGRAARVFDGKEYAVLHDYADEFIHRAEDRGKRRVAAYRRHQWDVRYSAPHEPSLFP